MIQIGKAIYTILSGATAVKTIVNSKIYPLIIPQDVQLPCVVFERSGNAQYNRDGVTYDTVIDITILCTNYAQSNDLAQAIFNTLNRYKGIISDQTIIDVQLISINEIYQEEAYIQKLQFQVKSI